MSSIINVLRRPGDLIHKPLQTLGGLASDALPLAGAGFLGSGAASFLGHNSWLPALNSMAGGGNAGGSGPWNGGGGGYGGSGYGGAGGGNPLDTMMNLPYTQKLMNRNPTDVFGGQDKNQYGVADTFKGLGNNFLQQGSGLPGLDNLGALSGARGVMNNTARMAGVDSPFGDFSGQSDPFALNSVQQGAANRTADSINQGSAQQVSSLRARMMANGITDPRALAAGEAQIRARSNSDLANTQQQAGQQAYQTRMNTLSGFVPQLNALYGAQANRQGQLFSMGESSLGNAGNIYGQGANRNMGAQSEQDSNIGHLLGLYFGQQGQPGGMGGGGNYGLPNLAGGGNTFNPGGFGGIQGSNESPYDVPGSDIYTNPFDLNQGSNPWDQQSTYGGY